MSEYQRQIAYANAQNAWGRLYNSLGLDLTPTNPNPSLDDLASAVEQSLDTWHRGVFARPPHADDRPKLSLQLSGVQGEQNVPCVSGWWMRCSRTTFM